MLALVKTAPGPGLELRDVPEPPIGINDVLVRVHKTGICGTDLHIASWDPWAAKTIVPPLVVGHEFVGEIVEVGSNVERLRGRATSSRARGTSSAAAAATAWPAAATSAPTTIGLGVGRDGAFAEYVALPMTNIWHHWAGIDEEVAAIFDPFGNAVHTALAFPVLGEDVLVSGAGPIGLMATAVARHAGARYVVVSEPNPIRRAIAERMGATLAVDPRERDLREVATGAGHGGGVRRRPRDVGQRGRPAGGDRGDGPRGRHRHPRDPDRGDLDRRQRDRLQDADACAASTAGRCTRPGTR